MQLEVGKCYVDRKGRVFGPLSRCGALFGEGPIQVSMWYNNGAASLSRESSLDLIAEHVPEPSYRMLRAGELIESGDEVYSCHHTWIPVVLSVGCYVDPSDENRLRRRIVQVGSDAVPEASSAPHMIETEHIAHVLRPGVDSVWNGNAWIPYTGKKTSLGMTKYPRARFLKSAAPVASPRDINYIPRYADGWKPDTELYRSTFDMLNIIFHPDSTSEERERAASTLVEAVYPEILARKQ